MNEDLNHGVLLKERFPNIKTKFEIEQGLSNEWDMFWLTSSGRRILYFEFSFNFRTEKNEYDIDYEDLIK